VGYYTSKYLVEYGAKLIGVAEAVGSVYNPNGINPEELQSYKLKKGTILGFPGSSKDYQDEGAIYNECDIFIPAALE
jgi:glutamate dehydrogenase (NAD(P)+)